MPPFRRNSGMNAQLRDQHGVALDAIDDALIVAASARPEAGKRMLQRLGFADAEKVKLWQITSSPA